MLRLLLALLLPAVFTAAAAAADVPALKARVTDTTGTLNSQQSAALEQTLAEFEARKGAQVAVLLVPTSQPETIEEYSVRVFEAWKLGRKGVDDGVLLVVAKNDRKLHIEVGYGLEGILPDAIAKRIIEDDIVPRFKQGDFYGGIRAGTDRIMRVVEGEKLPPPIARGHPEARSFNPDWLVPALILIVFAGNILHLIFGRVAGSGTVGVVLGIFVWAITGVFFFAVIAAVFAFVASLFVGSASGGRGWSSGGWGGGGWGGGGFGGGGFGGGGGGFSGGGGSSGGGGASGSW